MPSINNQQSSIINPNFDRSHAPAWERSLGRSSVLSLRRTPMARTRYVIQEPDKPHFLICTVLEWLPVFTRPDAVQIGVDPWS